MEEDTPQNETAPQETPRTAEAPTPSDSPNPTLRNKGIRDVQDALNDLWPPNETADESDEYANDAPIVRMANAILSTGIDSGASAIQCEPDRRNLRVRVRIDGYLQELMAIPKHIEPPLLRRYMVMADLNPFARNPQVGYIPIKHNNQNYTVRLSAIPSQWGMSQVLKIYNERMAILGVNKLGMMPTVQAITERQLTLPGLFLIAGPADSGRTTTAYRLLDRFNTIEQHTLSVEEMPGYRLAGVTQIYTTRMRGISHAEAIASARKLIPNMLFVGDITSREVAHEAVSAAESGIVVIGTLNAPDAVGGIQALMRLGVSPDRIAGAVTGILAQRLVRRLCTHCRESSDMKIPEALFYQLPDTYRFLDRGRTHPTTFYRASGCDACKQRGYQDRLGLYEVLEMDHHMHDALSGTVTPSRLRDAARMSGLHPLSAIAWEWAAVGYTSLDEARKVESGLRFA